MDELDRRTAIALAACDDEEERNRQLDAEILEAERAGGLRLLTEADLAELPPPKYLVKDFIRKAGFNGLFGPSGVGKSFLALDWALCVATGRPFYGQNVERGGVVYIATEGASGFSQRIRAWRLARGVAAEDVRDFRVLAEAVNFGRGETGALVKALDALPWHPALIVVDTMARSMVGGDENSAKDVGVFIDAVDQVRRRYGAAVLIVHHTGKDGNLERGSSALRGAADTLVALKPDDSELKLACEKQKDGPEFKPWHLSLAASGESVRIDLRTAREQLTHSEKQVLETVRAHFRTDWVAASAIADASGLSRTTAYETCRALVGRGLEVRRVGRQGKEYRLSEDSETAVRSRPKPSERTALQPSVRVRPSTEGGRNGSGGSEANGLSLEGALLDPEWAEQIRASVDGEWIRG